MPVAQVIRFDERQAVARPRRKMEPAPCVILCLHRPPRHSTAMPRQVGAPDEDRFPGRGRDPG